MPTVTPLSLRVKELREAKGLTQAQLADLVGIRRASLSAIENNSTASIDFDVLERLARALDVEHAGFLIVDPRASDGGKKRGRG